MQPVPELHSGVSGSAGNFFDPSVDVTNVGVPTVYTELSTAVIV